MNIKNHTSEIPASTSQARIEKRLVSAGAKNILKSYDDNQTCNAISFILPVDGKQLTFQLPAKVEEIYNALVAEYTRPTPRSFEICRQQAERTAWKIISDWVDIQLTMIALEQAEVLQMFFPFLTNGKETFYQRIKNDDFKLLSK